MKSRLLHWTESAYAELLLNREVGAELHLMGDGDVSGAIWARPDGPHDMLMGIGAAPEV